ncbi:MAG: DUF559 domain-containing protein [Bacteroidota bacterium]
MDGEVHNNASAQEKDHIRDTRLEDLGFIVLRFENNKVFNNPEALLNEIKV